MKEIVVGELTLWLGAILSVLAVLYALWEWLI